MIIFLNCSLKPQKSNSLYFLERLSSLCHQEPLLLNIRDVLKDIPSFTRQLRQADALVLGTPLYVDGMPAQLLSLMEMLHKQHCGAFSHLRLYVLSNLGFYESAQISVLLDIARNWCAKMGIVYGGGVAIGAGGMMGAFKGIPLNIAPNKALGDGLHKLADAIENHAVIENTYVQPTGIPRFIYTFAAHTLFRRTGRKNGVKVD